MMMIMRSKIPALLMPAMMVLACNVRPATTGVKESAGGGTESTDQLAAELAQSMHSPQGVKAIAALGTSTFSDYWGQIAASAPRGAVAVGSYVFAPVAANDRSKELNVASYAPFKTHQEYWDAMGFDANDVTASDIKEALRMLNDMQTGTNGFAPAVYENGGGLDANWHSDGQLGLANNIFGQMIHDYHCAEKAVAVYNRITGPVTFACELSCQSFWHSVNKCREVLKSSVESIRDMKTTLLNPGPTAATYTFDALMKIAEMGIDIAPRMEKAIGYVEYARAYIRGATTGGADSPDESDDKAGRNADEASSSNGKRAADSWSGSESASKGR